MASRNLWKQTLVDCFLYYVRWVLHFWRRQKSREVLEQRYWAIVEPVLAVHPQVLSREAAETYLSPWLKSMGLSHCPLQDGLPCLPFSALQFLETLLNRSSRIFEFGVGGSSVFFSSRVAELVSVEHDLQSYQKTDEVMKLFQGRNDFHWHGILVPPTPLPVPITISPSDPLSYCSSEETLASLSFYDYATQLEKYPNQYFDIILIDGRARPSCFLHATNRVRCGGYVILNNAERETYATIEATAVELGFEVKEFWGPVPHEESCCRTLFLRRLWFAINELDRKLVKYLDFDNGVFVEAGANDGIRQSNTLHFECMRGWRGILIEAIPALFEECQRNRPLAQVVWAALTPPEQVPGSVTIRYAGLMSTVKGGMRSAQEEDEHIDAGLQVQNLEGYEITAPSATLSGILDQCGVTHVDLLSLDIEGFEAQALAGLDLSRHRPEFILVEARYRADVEAVLLPHYEVVEQLSHHDVLYRRRRDR